MVSLSTVKDKLFGNKLLLALVASVAIVAMLFYSVPAAAFYMSGTPTVAHVFGTQDFTINVTLYKSDPLEIVNTDNVTAALRYNNSNYSSYVTATSCVFGSMNYTNAYGYGYDFYGYASGYGSTWQSQFSGYDGYSYGYGNAAGTTFTCTFSFNSSHTAGFTFNGIAVRVVGFNLFNSSSYDGLSYLPIGPYAVTVPSPSSIKIYSNNTNSSMAKAGDRVYVNVTFDQNVTVSNSFTIVGRAATNETIVANTTYRAYTDMLSGDSQGSIALNVSNYTNDYGQTGNPNTATTDSSYVTFDSINPAVAIISPSSASYQNTTTLSVNFTATDTNLDYTNISVINYTTGELVNSTRSTASGSQVVSITLPDGRYNVTATAYDLAGNFNSSTIVNIYIDTTAPTCVFNNITLIAGPGYVNGSTLFYRAAAGGNQFDPFINSSDIGGSGVSNVTFPNMTSANITTVGDYVDLAAPYNLIYFWDDTSSASGAKTVTCRDNAGNSNTTTFTLTPDNSAPNITLKYVTEPDNFYSPVDSAAGVIHFNVTINDTLSGMAYVVANLTNQTGTVSVSINMTSAGAGVWNGTIDASAVIAALPFSQDMPVFGYAIRVYPYNNVGGTPTFSNASVIQVLFHNLGAFQGPPAAMAGCFREGASVEGVNATNMSYIDNFGNVALTQIMQVNGSAACMLNFTGVNQAAPWGSTFSTVGYINFTGVNMSTQEQSSAVMSAMGQVVRMQMAPPHSFAPTRIFVNSSNLTALNVSAMIRMYNLPFSSKPIVLTDTGSALSAGAVSWQQGDYSATYQSKIGNLTINVSSFSGYNATDTVAPFATILAPVAAYNSSSSSIYVNISANGTGSEIYTLSINVSNNGTTYNYTSYVWNGTAATTNTANCSQVPASVGSEVVSCQLTMALSGELLYTINVSVADYGAPSNTNFTSSTFRVDLTRPTVTVQVPVANSVLPSNVTTLNFTLADAGANINTSSCLYNINGTNVAIANCANITLFNFTTDGVKTLIVYASDLAGNQGNTTISLLVNNASASATMLNTTTNASSNESIYVTPTSPAANITMASGATNVSLNFTAYNSTTFNVTLPEINVNATTSLGNVIMSIPNGTVVSGGSDWNGTLQLPMVKATSSVTPTAVSGYTNTVNAVVEIGVANYAVNLSKAVRILIPGMASKLVGFQRGSTFTAITTACSADTQVAGDALATGADCKINNGSDMVVWTKHFTAFAAYTQTASGDSSSGGSNNGGGSVGGAASVTSAKDTSTYSVDIGNSKFCTVSITRELESGNTSVLTTTLENTGASDCSLQDFVFADTIPDSFPAINELTFAPAYTSKSGWEVTFSFPSFAGGESKTLTYSANTWIGSSKVKNFTVYTMSAKKTSSATQPTTQTPQTTEETSAWIPRKLPTLPTEQPAAQPAAAPEAPKPADSTASLLITAVIVVLVLAGIGGLAVYLKGKKKGL